MTASLINTRQVRIGEICDLNPRYQGPADPNAEVSFIPMPAVSDTEGTILPHGVRPFSEVAKGYTRFRDGDVIFAKITPCMENGKIAIARNLHNGFACGSTEFHVLRPRTSVLPEYIWLFIRQVSFRKEAEHHMTGAVGQRRVPLQYIRDYAIPLPSLDEQRRIVAKLHGLLARSKSAREELAHIPKLVARYKQAILTAAFNGELTADWRRKHHVLCPVVASQAAIDGRANALDDLPKTWAWRPVGDVADVTGGLTKNSTRHGLPLKMPYLRVANVYANELRLDKIEEIGVTPAEAERVRLREGDLLIVEGNGSLDHIGRVALWQEELPNCGHQNHIIRASPIRGILPKFLLYWLLSPAGRAAIEVVASSSSGLHTLSISKIRGLPFPLCAEAEMAVVVEEIERRLAALDSTFGTFSRAVSLLNRLDQAILAKAFGGELIGQHSAPATVIFDKPVPSEQKRGARVV